MNANPILQNQDKTVHVLLNVMQKLLAELHPYETKSFRLSLDSSLDKDLRLDSLARVELISRLEQYFNIALPQKVFFDAESPRDLLRAINSAHGRRDVYPPTHVTALEGGAVENVPEDAATLLDVLHWHVKKHPNRLHIRILNDEMDEDILTYKHLWDNAQKIAAGLQQRGVQPGETVALMLPTGRDYFVSFYAILMCGAIPVPIYPPVRRSQLGEHLRRQSGILNNCAATILITVPEAKLLAKLLKSQVESLRDVITVADLSSSVGPLSLPVISAYDIAFLQYTSGSTGNPKGVVLTHANLLANIRVMGEVVKADSSDVFVSWLPLYHDMGLIAAWLGSLYFSLAFVVMSPLSFLARPQRWLWAIHQYRGTLSASPNFGYELCLKRIVDEDLKGLDLSSWRVAFNGAEPVSPDTLRRFATRFQASGVRPQIMLPVYGLAEASVGLAFPRLNQKPLIECVQREVFTQTGNAIPADRSDESALCFVTSGQPLPGHQIRIVDSAGRELPEREEGELQFSGPSVTSGYFRNPEETSKLFDQEWLISGDLAYLANGNVYITGRSKDIIIRAGRNIYPHELEEVIGNIPSMRKGCVVAFSSKDRHSGTERLIILAETREKDKIKRDELRSRIISVASDLVGLPPDEVILASSHTVLKTSSGKIRRSACRDLYESGRLDQTKQAFWLQITYMLMHALLPAWHRLKSRFMNNLYAGYAWSLFAVLSSLGWISAVCLPRLAWRWATLRALSRFLFFASGTKIKLTGLENLPEANAAYIYVANHSSYLDSLVMTAVIPRNFVFVAKIELHKNFFSRIPLQRLHAEFVERFETTQSLIDAQRISTVAKHNKSIFFFPEGTFMRVPGLREFHMGAFISAAQINAPVVPIAICGTRSILRAGSRFPHRGRISISVGKPIIPDKLVDTAKQDEWRVALKLRDEAREHILRYCGEPALLQ